MLSKLREKASAEVAFQTKLLEKPGPTPGHTALSQSLPEPLQAQEQSRPQLFNPSLLHHHDLPMTGLPLSPHSLHLHLSDQDVHHHSHGHSTASSPGDRIGGVMEYDPQPMISSGLEHDIDTDRMLNEAFLDPHDELRQASHTLTDSDSDGQSTSSAAIQPSEIATTSTADLATTGEIFATASPTTASAPRQTAALSTNTTSPLRKSPVGASSRSHAAANPPAESGAASPSKAPSPKRTGQFSNTRDKSPTVSIEDAGQGVASPKRRDNRTSTSGRKKIKDLSSNNSTDPSKTKSSQSKGGTGRSGAKSPTKKSTDSVPPPLGLPLDEMDVDLSMSSSATSPNTGIEPPSTSTFTGTTTQTPSTQPSIDSSPSTPRQIMSPKKNASAAAKRQHALGTNSTQQTSSPASIRSGASNLTPPTTPTAHTRSVVSPAPTVTPFATPLFVTPTRKRKGADQSAGPATLQSPEPKRRKLDETDKDRVDKAEVVAPHSQEVTEETLRGLLERPLASGALDALHSGIEQFWQNVSGDLKKIADDSNSPTIDRTTFETLFQKQGLLANKETLQHLAWQNLPVEVFQIAMPVARALQPPTASPHRNL